MTHNLTNKQMKKITSSASALVASANEGYDAYRQVTARTASTVINRSLMKSRKLPFSIREYLAFRDLSDFISVLQKNKTNLPKIRNADLLPVGHPASKKPHAMTASALRIERGRWFACDPRITSEEVRSIVASAFAAPEFSPEETYYLTRLSALPQGSAPLSVLLASYGGGNSRAARSARARMQRRDRKGRFAWQGGGMSALVRRRDGSTRRLTGRTVAQGVGNDDTFDFETPDGKIYRVPASSAESSKGYLELDEYPDGYSPAAAKISGDDVVIPEESLVTVEAPNGFRRDESYDGPGTRYTDDAYTVTKLDPNNPDHEDAIPGDFWSRDVSGKMRIDDKKPVYLINRDDGGPVAENIPLQNWGDVQDAIRADEPVRDREEGREPDPIATLNEEQLNRLYEEVGDRDPYEAINDILGKTAQPKAEETAFEFDDPTGADLVDDSDQYEPMGRTSQDSEDYTDDPAILAQRYSEDELRDALEEAVTPGLDRNPPGDGELEFDAGPESVPAQALYDALKEQGADARGTLQSIYDKIGGKETAPREEAPEAPEAPEAEQPEAPEVRLPAIFDGLTDEEKQDLIQNGNYADYLPENPEFDVPPGYYPVDTDPFENVEENPDIDPINLANNFDTDDLREGLAESLRPDAERPGYGILGRTDEDGEESFTTAPVEAIRDAIQMQGEDPNPTIEEVYNEGRPEEPEADAGAEAADALDDLLGELEDDGAKASVDIDDSMSVTLTGHNGKEYTVGTRVNDDDSVDLVLADNQGREVVESTGTRDDLDELNAQAAQYAQAIQDGDDLGVALTDLVDDEVATESTEELESDEEVSPPTPTPPTPDATEEAPGEEVEELSERDKALANPPGSVPSVGEDITSNTSGTRKLRAGLIRVGDWVLGDDNKWHKVVSSRKFSTRRDADRGKGEQTGTVLTLDDGNTITFGESPSTGEKIYDVSSPVQDPENEVIDLRNGEFYYKGVWFKKVFGKYRVVQGPKAGQADSLEEMAEKIDAAVKAEAEAPKPTPDTTPQPKPTPEPRPTPQPTPQPKPTPQPRPVPEVEPETEPEPQAELEPAPEVTETEEEDGSQSYTATDSDGGEHTATVYPNGDGTSNILYTDPDGNQTLIAEGIPDGEAPFLAERIASTAAQGKPITPTGEDVGSGFYSKKDGAYFTEEYVRHLLTVDPESMTLQEFEDYMEIEKQMSKEERKALRQRSKEIGRVGLRNSAGGRGFPKKSTFKGDRTVPKPDESDEGETAPESEGVSPDGEGRTEPNPSAGKRSKPVVPSQDFYYVDPGGKKTDVKFTEEYVEHLFKSDPETLTNQEIKDLLTMMDQLPEADKNTYKKKIEKLRKTQLDRAFGVEEPVTKYPGDRYDSDNENLNESDASAPAPGEYTPGALPTPKPAKPERPVPGEGRKQNLNRRARRLLAEIEKSLNEMLDYGMPDSFYPNLPQKQRQELFDRRVAELEATLEDLRTSLRNYIKTKDGSENNQESLDAIAAQIDLARRQLQRLERGGFRGVNGDERDSSIVSAENTINELSDWVEEAIDDDWTPSLEEEDQDAPAPTTTPGLRPRTPLITPSRPEPKPEPEPRPYYVGEIDTDRPWWRMIHPDLMESPWKYLDSLSSEVGEASVSPRVREKRSKYEDVLIGEYSLDFLREDRSSSRGGVDFRKIFSDALDKAALADVWEEDNPNEGPFEFNDDMFRNAELDYGTILNKDYLVGQISKLRDLLRDGGDPEEIAYVANSLNPIFNPKNPDPVIDENPLVKILRSKPEVAELIRKGLDARGVSVDSADPVETFKPASRTPRPSAPKPSAPKSPEAEKTPKPAEPKKPAKPRAPRKPKDGETGANFQKIRDSKTEGEPATQIEPGTPLPEDDYDYSDEAYAPTEEQRNAITAIMTGAKTVIRALAGSGKTSTLRMAANRILKENPTANVLYVAFNKAIQAEATGVMPENTMARTADSLANQDLKGRRKWAFMVKRLNADTQKEYKGKVIYSRADIATHFGVDNMTLPSGEEIGFTEVVRLAEDAVKEFAISADDEILPKHFKGNAEDPENVPAEILDLARRMWADKTDPEGVLEVKHEDIFKQWALLRPNLRTSGPGRPAFDVVFVDEAQDINPVLAKLLEDQDVQVVMVGDSNQAIYGFRGAVDELDKVEASYDLPLTQSFRFGDKVGGVGNRFLSLLKSKFRIKASGPEGEVVPAGTMTDPDAILTRTNIGKAMAVIEAMKLGKRVAMDKNSRDDLIEFIQSARNLRFGSGKVTHPDLRGFKDWNEAVQAVEEGTAGPRASQFLNFLRTKEGTDALTEMVRKVKFPFVERLTADRYIPEITKEDLDGETPVIIHLTPSRKVFFSPEQIEEYKKEHGGKKPRTKQSAVPIHVVTRKNEDGSVSVWLYSNVFSGPTRDKFLYDAKRSGFTEVADYGPDNSAVPLNKNGSKQKASLVTFVADENGTAEENALRAINDLRQSWQGVNKDEVDITVITAHVSKGLEYDRVKIDADFDKSAPKIDEETGEKIMPDDEELRLAYVAATRAKKQLDPGGLAWIFDETSESDASSDPDSARDDLILSLESMEIRPEFGSQLQDIALNPDAYLAKNPDVAVKLLEAKKKMPGADVEEIDKIINLINAQRNKTKPTKKSKPQKAQDDKKVVETLNEERPDNEQIDVPSDQVLEERASRPLDYTVAKIEEELSKENLGGGQWQVWSKDVDLADGRKIRYEVIVQKNKNNTFSVVHRMHDVTNEGSTNSSELVGLRRVHSYPASHSYETLRDTVRSALGDIALSEKEAGKDKKSQVEAIIELFNSREAFERPQDVIDNPSATHVSADGWNELSIGDRVYDHVRGRWGTITRVVEVYRSGRKSYTDYVEWLPDGYQTPTRAPSKNFFIVDGKTGAWTPTPGISVPDFYKGERRVPVSPPVDGYSNPPMATAYKKDLKLKEKEKAKAKKRAERAERERRRQERRGEKATPEPTEPEPSPEDEAAPEEELPADDAAAAADALDDLLNGFGEDDSAGPDEVDISGNWTRSDKMQFLGKTRDAFYNSRRKFWQSNGYEEVLKRDIRNFLNDPINERVRSGEITREEADALIDTLIEEKLYTLAMDDTDKFIADEIGSPSKIYVSGRGSTVAVSARGVTDEQVSLFLETIDQLEAITPRTGMVYVISNNLRADGVMASTIASDHIMLVRPSIIVPGDATSALVAHQNWMAKRMAKRKKVSVRELERDNLPPGVEEELNDQFDSARKDAPISGLLGVLIHEMGHAVDTAYSTPGDGTSIYKDREYYEKQNPEGLKALTAYANSKYAGTYAKKSPMEAYAEAFSAWVIDGGNPRSPEVAAVAAAFGWAEQFPDVAKIKTRPDVFGQQRDLESDTPSTWDSESEGEGGPMRAMSMEGANPEVFSPEGKILPGVSVVRVDDLPDSAKKKIDDFIQKYDIDVDGMADTILSALENPDIVEVGRAWYKSEFQASAIELAEKTGYPVDVVTAVIAITSARNRWSTLSGGRPNLETAEAFLEAHKNGLFDNVTSAQEAREVNVGYLMGNGFGWNVIQLLKGEISIDEAVTGTKRRSFYNNGLDPDNSDHITIDVWMGVFLAQNSSIDQGDVGSLLSTTKPPKYLSDLGMSGTPAYLLVSEATMRAHARAIALGYVDDTWLPHQTQAAAWEAIRLGLFGPVPEEVTNG